MTDLSKLSYTEFKRRFTKLPPTEAINTSGRKAGAVLAIFMDSPQGLSLLFTKRAADLEEHAGQISFPGGGLEKQDADYKAAAFRETYEEVGISSSELELLGALPAQPVLDQWVIHPFAAWWTKPRPLSPCPAEVDRVIISPVASLLNQHQRECWLLKDPSEACRYRLEDGEVLWGATGRITGRLFDALAQSGRDN